jgi:hypothetical protein
MNDHAQSLGKQLASAPGLEQKDGNCPSAEEIADLIDEVLTDEERAKLQGHLAACSRCREVHLVASELARLAKKVTRRRAWCAAALAALAVVVALAMFISLRKPALQQLRLPRTTQAPIKKLSVLAADEKVVTQPVSLVAPAVQKLVTHPAPQVASRIAQCALQAL